MTPSTTDDLVARLVDALTPDLLLASPTRDAAEAFLKTAAAAHRRWLRGYCYVACEALFHLGLAVEGWKPAVVHHEGVTHWFLRNAIGEILDPTAGQFTTPVPYHAGRGCGFLTKHASRRARLLIDRLDDARGPDELTCGGNPTKRACNVMGGFCRRDIACNE